MKGLYFYKLVSPYSEDVTKDCKLSVNEIDSNFLNLKNADIKEVYVDNEEKKLILYRNDGEELVADLTKVTDHNFNISYDSIDGAVTIEYNGEKYIIDRLITKDNLSKEILTKVYSDNTLEGNGTAKTPLRIASVQKTGQYKPAIRIIDATKGEKLPKHKMIKGDRYVVYEEVSDYGLLYNFHDVEHLNDLLKDSGWRIPTKKDWDDMLNALEPCEFRNHDSCINNTVLGKYAGTLLKSTFDWRTPFHSHEHHTHCNTFHDEKPCKETEEFDVEINDSERKKHPDHKPIDANGIDAYGMTILPAGFAYFANPIQYNFFGLQGAFWTSDMLHDTDVYAKVFDSKQSGVIQIAERPSAFLSIRLVKDYDGSNHKGVENILGQNYHTTLLPSLKNSNGYAIWTTQNLNAKGKHQCSVKPNSGLRLEYESDVRKVYFIHEWNGFGWDRLEMEEGDSVTILEGKRHNEAYRVIDGVLVNVTNHIIETINAEFKDTFDNIYSRLDVIEDTLNENGAHISDLEKALAEEIASRKEKDTELEERIAAEEKKRHEDVDDLYDALDIEYNARKKRDDELQEAIDTEIIARKKRDDELQEAIDREYISRKEAIQNLQTQVDIEVEARKNGDNYLQDMLAAESQKRHNEDQAIYNALEIETASRKKRDDELQEAIDREVAKRGQDVQDLWNETSRIETKLNNEIDRATAAEDALDKRTTFLEENRILEDESDYNNEDGVLTLGTVDPKNTIKIEFAVEKINSKEGVKLFSFGEC